MEIYEITGFQTGISRSGVNFLQPADSFQNIENGFIHRQVLQSRKGFKKFSTGHSLTGHLPTRVTGIFQNVITSTGAVETLVFDQNFAYKYNESTNAFDRITFGGSLAGFAGFGLTARDDYISGVTYPAKNGDNRFVFTSRGMPAANPTGVFFYNGTNILDYTDGGMGNDNPDYIQFATGDITRAVHVISFIGRLNFVGPTIGSRLFQNGMLHSATATADGLGDNYNASGAGLLLLNTNDVIRGAVISGFSIALNLNKSTWMLDPTGDAFIPYFKRRLPSVLGTDASFSSVAWNDEVHSIGRTGILSTKGRQSLRIDNKIPFFTGDEIEGTKFEEIYGGFDRANSQFMWAYIDRGTGSNTQDKVLVENYEEKSWSVYDQRFSCFGESTNGQRLVWNDINATNNPAWGRMDTTEEIWNKIGRGEETEKTLAGDDAGFIYELNQDFDDYFVIIETPGISKASSAVITTDDQAFAVGDKVVITEVVGMTEINGLEAIVTAQTISTITININTTNFTPWSSGGNVSKVISFKAETIPFNPYRDRGARCRISHVEFLLDTNGGNLRLDILMDGEATPFKSNVLLKPGKVIVGGVTAIDITGDPAIEITTVNTSGLVNGNVVSFANVEGTTELNGNLYSVSEVTSTTFEIQQAGATAYTVSPGTWTFNEPQLKDREWVTVQVNNTADFTVFRMRQETAAKQVKLTSIRIHCEPASLTTD